MRYAGRGLARRLEGWSRLGAIDMARTRAFSEELNYAPSIWLNVRGRDPLGTIEPGAEYDATSRRSPTESAGVAASRDRRADRRGACTGATTSTTAPHAEDAPDLVLELALENGYSQVVLADDAGRHARSVRRLDAPRSSSAGKGGGMNGSHRPEGLWVLAGRGVSRTGPRQSAEIVDVAPTVLHLAGLPVGAVDGRASSSRASRGEPTIATGDRPGRRRRSPGRNADGGAVAAPGVARLPRRRRDARIDRRCARRPTSRPRCYRVAIVAACPFPTLQGSQLLIRNLAQGLLRPRARGRRRHLCRRSRMIRRRASAVHRIPRVAGCRARGSGPHAAKLVLDARRCSRASAGWSRRERIELMHAHNYEAALVGAGGGERRPACR